MTTRRLAVGMALGAYVPARTARWPDGSRLFVVGDGVGWSIDDDPSSAGRDRAAARLRGRARALGALRAAPGRVPSRALRRVPAALARFVARARAQSYFHGRPGRPATRSSTEAYEALRSVTQTGSTAFRSRTRRCTSSSSPRASSPTSVFRIPIGVDLEHFPLGDRALARTRRARRSGSRSRRSSSARSRRTASARGRLEPKLVKGPDTLVATLARLRESRSRSCSSLLTGPARGYVRRELERLRHPVPPRRIWARATSWLAPTTHSTSYLVTSRQEGGPKAVLESMATGVPLVTTRVGQAPELVCRRRERPPRRRRRRRGARRRGAASPRRCRACGASAGGGTADRRGIRGRAPGRSLGRAARRLCAEGRVAAWQLTSETRRAVHRGLRSGGRDSSLRPRRSGLRVFYGHDRVPAQGEPVAGGTAKFQRLVVALSERPGRLHAALPRLDLAAARPATAARSRQSAWRSARPEPGRRRLSRLGRGGDRRAQPPYRRALLAADHVLYQSEFSKLSADTFLGEPRGYLGGPPQRRRHRATSLRPRTRRPWARFCCSAATRRRPTGSSSALRTFALVLRPSRRRGCSSPAASSPRPSPARRAGPARPCRVPRPLRPARGARDLCAARISSCTPR